MSLNCSSWLLKASNASLESIRRVVLDFPLIRSASL